MSEPPLPAHRAHGPLHNVLWYALRLKVSRVAVVFLLLTSLVRDVRLRFMTVDSSAMLESLKQSSLGILNAYLTKNYINFLNLHRAYKMFYVYATRSVICFRFACALDIIIIHKRTI